MIGVDSFTDGEIRSQRLNGTGAEIDEPIPLELLIELERADLGVLRPWLTAYELDAATARRTELLAARAFPDPPEDRRAYPWPPV